MLIVGLLHCQCRDHLQYGFRPFSRLADWSKSDAPPDSTRRRPRRVRHRFRLRPRLPRSRRRSRRLTCRLSPWSHRNSNIVMGPCGQHAEPSGGPYTCVVAMYLNSNDPTQFEVVRTFQPRFPGNVYGPAQPVSSPTVSASYTHTGQLANNVTSLTVYPHPENPYGKDTLTVYTVDSHGNIILPALTPGPIPILVYPVSTAKISNSLSIVANPASNPSSSFATSPPLLLPRPIPVPPPIRFPTRLRLRVLPPTP